MNVAISGKIDSQYNRPWPPTINSIIIINHPEHNDNLFVGFVYKYLWDNLACIVLLLNNMEYTEKILVDHKIVDNELSAKGTLVLLPSYGWKYTDIDKLVSIFNKTKDDIQAIILQRKTEFETKTILHNYPITRMDLMTHGIYKNREKAEETECKVNEGVKDESLLTKDGEMRLDTLFRENELFYAPNEQFTPIDDDIQNILLKELQKSMNINEKSMIIIVNKNIAVKNIIESVDDEINEGNKIIKWIQSKVMTTVVNDTQIFQDLKLAIHNGYVHIGRKGVNVNDKITQNMIEKLHYFKWQYGIPIDYDTLKYILFQTQYQKKLLHDTAQRIEVEKILSQGSLICIHPEPKYLMYAFKRLMLAWYADKYLTSNIRKIKILINQWRANASEPFNQRYGVMPMIVVYPRYGKESAKTCVMRIAEYFTLYNNIAWSCSPPSYFIKINDLLYYTNGHLDLKLYFRRVTESHNGNVTNASFDTNLKKLIGAESL